jgi:hypothetical protein
MFVTESHKTAYPQTVLASANLCLRLLQARLAFTEFLFLSQRACNCDWVCVVCFVVFASDGATR